MLSTLSLRRGDTHRFSVVYKDSSGVPIPLSSARLQARFHSRAAAAFIDLTVGDGLTLSAPGRVDVTMSSAVTTAAQNGVWDLEVTTTGGDVKTLVEGVIQVSEDVTHA